MTHLLFGFSLTIIAFLSVTNADTCDSFQELRCSAPECNIRGNSVILKEGLSLSCTVAYIADRDIPNIKPNTSAAPPLNFLNVSCYQTFSLNQGKYKAALDVVWTSEEIHIRQGHVKGYFIDFSAATFNVTLEFRETEASKERVPDCIKFSYNCYGIEYRRYLVPDSEIIVSVRPRPRSQKGDSYNLNWTKYKVPNVQECPLPNVETTSSMQNATTGSREKSHQGNSPAIEIYIVAAVAGFVIVMLVTGLVVFFVRKKKDDQKKSDSEEERECLSRVPKHILMVANRKERFDCERAQTLAKKLRTKCGLGVTCDFENTKQTVHQQRLPTWFIQARRKADTVIFINGAGVLRQIRENCEDSRTPEDNFIFEIFYHFHENDFACKKNIFLEDTDEHTQYIRDSGGSSCEIFTLEEDFNENGAFYRHFLGVSKTANVGKGVKDENDECVGSFFMHSFTMCLSMKETNKGTVKTTTV